MMRVLGLCSYPIESAATRFRMAQFVEPLAERGIELDVRPFLDSRAYAELYKPGSTMRKALGLLTPLAARVGDVFRAGRYDAVFVQREAMFFGPEIIEWLVNSVRRVPMILDLDDATYLSYVSPTYGRIGSLLKFFGKTDRLIRRADAVLCGNEIIAKYVESKHARATVLPTIVDTHRFIPVEKTNDIPVLGWIGTHSTFPSIQALFPVLRRLAEKHRFRLRLVGTGRSDIDCEGVDVQNLEWDLSRDVSDFQSLDIGLYPIKTSSSMSEQWIAAKSGFKAIQYMAVGIPFVMTPVGVCSNLGVEGSTHFSAATDVEWYSWLDKLLSDRDFRLEMGRRAREYCLRNFTVEINANVLVRVFEDLQR